MIFSAVNSNAVAGPANSITLTSSLSALPSGSAIFLVVKGKLVGGKSSTLQIRVTADSGYTSAPGIMSVNSLTSPIYQAGAAAGMGNAVFLALTGLLAHSATGAWAGNLPSGVTLTAATVDGSMVEDFVFALYAIEATAGTIASPPKPPSGTAPVGSWYFNHSDSATTSMQVAMNGSTQATGMALVVVGHLDGTIGLTPAAGFTQRLDSSGLVIDDDYFGSAFAQQTVGETFASADVYAVASATYVDGGVGDAPTPDTPPSDTVVGECTGTVKVYLGLGTSPYLGTGADGAMHFDGVNAVAHCTRVGSIYTATAKFNATSVLIDAGVTLRKGGFNHCCQGDWTNNGIEENSGQDGIDGGPYPNSIGGLCGADGSGNAGNLPKLTTRTGHVGGFGTDSGGGGGGNTGVTSPGQPGASAFCGGNGGAGGASFNATYAGGVGGTGGVRSPRFTCPADIAAFISALYNSPSSVVLGVTTNNVGGGGGGGGGGANGGLSGLAIGGAAGGYGGNGEWDVVFANRFLGTGVCRSKGGKGGNGIDGHFGSGDAGGGGGGAAGNGGDGGLIVRVSSDMPSVTADVAGGLPGTPGAGGAGGTFGFPPNVCQSGASATPGSSGSDGLVILVATAAAPLTPVSANFSLGTIGGVANDAQALLLMPAFNAGDRRAQKRFGDLFIEAQVPVNSLIQVALWSGQYSAQVPGYSPSTLTPANGGLRAPYVIDFASGNGFYGVDLEAAISWELGTGASLVTWQPTVISQPESIQNRPTDWDAAGTDGAKFVQGLLLEADTFGLPKTFTVQSSDDLSFHSPTEAPVTFTGQSIIPFSFSTPFIAHSMRIHSTDDVPWRIYGVRWVTKPFPESMVQWITEGISHGLLGWQHIFMLNVAHISTVDLRVEMTFDGSRTLDVVVPNSGGLFQKTKVPVGVNKFKTVSYKVTCDSSGTAPFRLFFKDLEIWCKQWGSVGPYSNVKPFGGDSSDGAEV